MTDPIKGWTPPSDAIVSDQQWTPPSDAVVDGEVKKKDLPSLKDQLLPHGKEQDVLLQNIRKSSPSKSSTSPSGSEVKQPSPSFSLSPKYAKDLDAHLEQTRAEYHKVDSIRGNAWLKARQADLEKGGYSPEDIAVILEREIPVKEKELTDNTNKVLIESYNKKLKELSGLSEKERVKKLNAGFLESAGKRAADVVVNTTPGAMSASRVMNMPSSIEEIRNQPAEGGVKDNAGSPDVGEWKFQLDRTVGDFSAPIDEMIKKSYNRKTSSMLEQVLNVENLAYLGKKALKKVGIMDDPKNQTSWGYGEQWNDSEREVPSVIHQALVNTKLEIGDISDPKIKESTFNKYFNEAIANVRAKKFDEVEEQQNESRELLDNVPLTWEDAKAAGNKSGYVGGAIGMGVGSSALGIAASAVSGPGAVLAMAPQMMSMYQMESAEAYDKYVNAKAQELTKKYGTEVSAKDVITSGQDRDAAEMASNIGKINSVLEQVGFTFGAGKLATSIFKKKVIEQAIKKGAGRQLVDAATGIGSAAAAEMATEASQTISTIIGQAIIDGKSIDEAVAGITEKDVDEILESTRQGGIGGAFFGGLGSVGSAFQQRDVNKLYEAISGLDDKRLSELSPLIKGETKEEKVKSAVEAVVNGEIKRSDIVDFESRERLISTVKNVKKAFKRIAPETKVKFYAGDTEGSKILAELGEPDRPLNGLYDKSSGTIYINEDTFESNTGIHEGFHPIINALKVASPEKYEQFALEASAMEHPTEKGKTYADVMKTGDEALVEYLADIANGKFNESLTLKEKAIKFVNTMLETVGLDQFVIGMDVDTSTLSSLAKGLADAVRKGQAVNEFKQSSKTAPQANAPAPAKADPVAAAESAVNTEGLKEQVNNSKDEDGFVRDIITDYDVRYKNRKAATFLSKQESTDSVYANKPDQEIDQNIVKEWQDKISNGERPVIIKREDGSIDGHHKLEAYKNLNIKQVPVVYESDLRSFYRANTEATKQEEVAPVSEAPVEKTVEKTVEKKQKAAPKKKVVKEVAPEQVEEVAPERIEPVQEIKKEVVTDDMVKDFLQRRDQSNYSSDRSIFSDIANETGIPEDQLKEGIMKRFIESDLPTKKFNKKQLLDVDNLPKGEISPKPIPQNITKTKPKDSLKNIASKDQSRPAQTGVFMDAENKVMVATDGMVLVTIPDNKITKTEIRDFNNKVIDERFPQYQDVIPGESQLPFKNKINVNDLLNKASGAARANNFLDGFGDVNNIKARVRIGDNDFYFDPLNLVRALKTLAENGVTEASFSLSRPNRAAVMTGNGITALVMPVMGMEGETTYSTIIDREQTAEEIARFNEAEIATLNKSKENSQKEIDKKPKDKWTAEYYGGKIKEIDAQIAELKAKERIAPTTAKTPKEIAREKINSLVESGDLSIEGSKVNIITQKGGDEFKKIKEEREAAEKIQSQEKKSSGKIKVEVENTKNEYVPKITKYSSDNGFIEIGQLSNGDEFVNNIQVDESARGKGIASDLIQAALVGRDKLSASTSNPSSVKAFYKNGFFLSENGNKLPLIKALDKLNEVPMVSLKYDAKGVQAQAPKSIREVYNQKLDDKDINSIRASLRMKAPFSYALQVLDDLQEAKKNDLLSIDDVLSNFIDNGITLNNIKNILFEDEIFDSAKDIDSYFSKIGGLESLGLFNRLSGSKNDGVQAQESKSPRKPIYADVVNGFYSPMEQRLSEAKQEKQTVNKWKALIGGGDEAKWTGVTDWLNSKKPDQTISKSEIMDFMKENRVEIAEVVKGSRNTTLSEKELKSKIESKGYTLEFDMGGDGYLILKDDELVEYDDLPSDVKQWYEWLAEITNPEETSGQKYSQYQLPGEKENYKEVLVTLPLGKDKKSFEEWVVSKYGEGTEAWTEGMINAAKQQYKSDITQEKWAGFQNVSATKNAYKSSHFDEPNILVHLRMNTRTDVQGNKVLFLEELQSDWGQQGKKEGFKDNNDLTPAEIQEKKEINERTNKAQPVYNRMLDLAQYIHGSFSTAQQLKDLAKLSVSERIKLIEAKYKQVLEDYESMKPREWQNEGFLQKAIDTSKRIYEKQLETAQESFDVDQFEKDNTRWHQLTAKQTKQAIPSAPFVTDTNSWTKLGLKVALKEAAKQEADKIAWTTGEQQNERYDLSKQVNYIQFTDTDRGRKYVDVSTPSSLITFKIEPDGTIIENKNTSVPDAVGKNLSDVIGKDMTDKILGWSEKFKTTKEYYEQYWQKDINNKSPKWEDLTEAELKAIKGQHEDTKTGHKFEGEGLKIGGKGMKGFYGSPTEGSLGIVGNAAKSLFKQEIGTVDIPEGEGIVGKPTIDQLNKAKDLAEEANDADAVSFLQEQIKRLEKGQEESFGLYNPNVSASKFFDQVREPKILTQHSIDVTQELRSQVNEGLPQFQERKLNRTAARVQQDITDNWQSVKASINSDQEPYKYDVRSITNIAEEFDKMSEADLWNIWNTNKGIDQYGGMVGIKLIQKIEARGGDASGVFKDLYKLGSNSAFFVRTMAELGTTATGLARIITGNVQAAGLDLKDEDVKEITDLAKTYLDDVKEEEAARKEYTGEGNGPGLGAGQGAGLGAGNGPGLGAGQGAGNGPGNGGQSSQQGTSGSGNSTTAGNNVGQQGTNSTQQGTSKGKGSNGAYKRYRKAQAKRANSQAALTAKAASVTPRGLDKLLLAILQGNVLGLPSVMANIYGNTIGAPARWLEDIGGTTAVQIMNAIHGQPTVGLSKQSALLLVNPWFRGLGGLGVGAKKGAKAMVYGTQQGNKLGDDRSLHPFDALVQLISRKGLPVDPKTGKVTWSTELEKTIEGLAGWNPEMMFRLLELTDAPFRESRRKKAEYLVAIDNGAKSVAEAKLFIAGMSKAQKVQVENIAQAGVFADDRTLSRSLQGLVNAIGKSVNVLVEALPEQATLLKNGLGAIAKTTLRTPFLFTKIPANLTQLMIELRFPVIAWAGATKYTASAALNARAGKMELAKAQYRKAGELMTRGLVGVALNIAMDSLLAAGLLTAGTDDDKPDEKAAKYEGPQPSSINYSGLLRYRRGLDPSHQPGDHYINFSRFGQLGMFMAVRTEEWEKNGRKPHKDSASYLDMSIRNIQPFLKGISQAPFMEGAANVLGAMENEKGSNYYFSQTLGALSNIPNVGPVIPGINPLATQNNNYATYVKTQAPYILKPGDKESVSQSIIEKISTRKNPLIENAEPGVVPARNIWGEKVPMTPEGSNPLVYHFLDIRKGRTIEDPWSIENFKQMVESPNRTPPITAPNNKVNYIAEKTREDFLYKTGGDYSVPDTYVDLIQAYAGKMKRQILADVYDTPEKMAEFQAKDNAVKWRIMNEINSAVNKSASLVLKKKVYDDIAAGKLIPDHEGKIMKEVVTQPYSDKAVEDILKQRLPEEDPEQD